MGIGWAYLIHQTLFVGVMRMKNKVVGGQWLGPVYGLLCGFLLSYSNPVHFFGINSCNSQETNSN
jgi:hypothetical protein